MKPTRRVSRRASLKTLAAAGGWPALGGGALAAAPPADTTVGWDRALRARVFETPFVDTHEHLLEESDRLQGTRHPRVHCDDWAFLLSHYLDSDLLSAGMPQEVYDRFFGPQTDPWAKWALLEPYWSRVRHTGYAQAVRIALKELYGVEELSGDTVRQAQAGYEKLRQRGFYRQVLQERARLESCQVNCLTGEPFKESAHPTLLMQDLSIVGMFAGPALETYGKPTGLPVTSLADWHRVIDWWFQRYAPYAVAVKSQHAYSRDIDYVRTPPEQAEPVFKAVLERRPVSADERRRLEDHLFWYAVDQATAAQLPVKLHTGYYAGANSMPLARLARNAGSAADLCRQSPQTRFVFMHMCYPYYEDILAVTKHYANAYLDLCWAWIINPLATKDLVKKYLVTAPANKLLTFGGDYIPVEPVLGHATIARNGLAQALTELTTEGWLQPTEALNLVDPLMRGNARALFRLAEKHTTLEQAPWAKPA